MGHKTKTVCAAELQPVTTVGLASFVASFFGHLRLGTNWYFFLCDLCGL